MSQKKLPFIGPEHGSETRNTINEIIRTLNDLGYTYNESLQMARDILNEAKQTNAMNENVQQQINTLIAESGTSDAELVQARTDLKGVTHLVLKDRLDETEEEIESRLADAISTENKPPGHSVWDEFDERGVNPTWFGAIGDANYYDEVNKKYYADESMTIPATNNLQPFQDAVDYLESIGGGTLYVPSGTFCIKSDNHGVKWKSKVSMIGAGINNTKFVAEGDVFDFFYNRDIPANGEAPIEDFLEDVRFENFECDMIGLASAHANVLGKAFFILGMRRARFNNLFLKNTIGTALGCDFLTETVISNVVVYNAGRNYGVAWPDGTLTTAGQSGIGVGTASLDEETVVISNCHTYNCANHGIFVEQQGSAGGLRSKFAKIINCHVEGSRIGIADKGSIETIITGCTAYKNSEHGIEIRQFTEGDIISGCIVSKNGGNGIELAATAGDDMSISGNHIHNNDGHGIRSSNASGRPFEQARRNLKFAGNKINNNGFSGIFISNTHKSLMFSDNDIFNNGQNQSNTYSDSGIYISDVDQFSILGNQIFDDQEVKTQRVGIRFEGMDISNFLIDDNIFRGNSARNLQILRDHIRKGVIGDNNIGIKSISRGKVTIPNGLKAIDVQHDLITPAEFITVTPIGASPDRLWVKSAQTNIFRVERESTVGDMDFYWEAKI